MSIHTCTCENNRQESFKALDQHARTVIEQQQAAAVPESQGGRVAHLVKVYASIKPLLSVLASLPIIPSVWRSALSIFTSALDAVTLGAGDPNADFKAGKDL